MRRSFNTEMQTLRDTEPRQCLRAFASLCLCVKTLCVATVVSSCATHAPFGEWRVEPVSEVARPSDVAIQLSGIAWRGGDSYLAVDDTDVCLHPLTLAIRHADGSLPPDGVTLDSSPPLPLADASDPEACVWDATAGTVWVADEKLGVIREHRLSDGAALRAVPVPASLQRPCNNLGLESLALSPDGLTLWTANEDTLPADGARGSATAGALVRLVKYTRTMALGDWHEAGQWAYRADPLDSEPHPKAVSGVAELAVLPDGSLLVLERTFAVRRRIPSFEFRLYHADVSGARELSGLASLQDADVEPADKRLLYRSGAGFANYEGMCLGPTLDDGSRVLVLVSDGGGSPLLLRSILTLRLRQ